ncbi:MAG TPA: cell wall-binding repeat-containing protein [Nitriliruptorales bacterium]
MHGGIARTVTVLVAVVATVLVPVLPAAGGHPDPGVIRIQPPPGEVVPAGSTVLTGVLFSTSPISDVQVRFGGQTHSPQLRALDGHNQRFSVTVSVAPGSHVADVSFVADGKQTRRLWRFAATDVATRRHAGPDRIATAVAMSRDTFPDDGLAPGAVLATAWDFPDALAAAPVAHAIGGPLLLSDQAGLSDATADELSRALGPLATVTIMGGPSALSQQVADDVEALGFRVERIEGDTREHTAALAAERHLGSSATVIVAASHAFADALSAAAPAARDGIPILLSDRSRLSPATRAYLESHDVDRAVVVGGEGVLTSGVAAELGTLVADVERVSGADRFATSLAVLERFYRAVDGVSLADGSGFADALAGGAHAAALGHPLLLARSTGLTEPTTQRLTQLDVTVVDLYGGHAAMGARVERGVRRAAANDPGGPQVLDLSPAPSRTVPDLDTIQVTFDRAVQPHATSVFVTLDGLEWYGALGHGDFADTVVFRPGELPIPPDRGVDHDVDVWVLTYDGEAWHHLHWHFVLHRLEVSRGDVGEDVRELQQRLLALGYWLPQADGEYGYSTAQAVMAFQKWEGLARTGTADRLTLDHLFNAHRPTPRSPRSGRWVEIDKTRQVMLFNLDGAVQWTMNTSTGTETQYTRPDGSKGVAHTPEGEFTFSRQIDGMREADLGQMWRPKYFTSAGHAIHGSTSVPAHAASHGCARLSYPGIDYVWAAGLAPIGSRILIYR